MSNTVETDFRITPSIFIDHNFNTGALETITSNNGYCFGFNQITILCRPTQPVSLEVHTGFQPRIEKGKNFNLVPLTNNDSDFQKALTISLSADEHFCYKIPVKFTHYFIRIIAGNTTAHTFQLNSYLSHENPNPLTFRDADVPLEAFTQTTRPISDFDLEIKDNNLIGLEPFKFKAQGDFSNNERLLTFAPYNPLGLMVQSTTANRAFVIASNSTSDDHGSVIAGAKKVRYTGLSETGLEVSVETVLDGTTGVLQPATNMCCVNGAEVIEVGTLEVNVGAISMDEHPVNDHVFQMITGENKAFMPIQYIPANKRVYINNIKINYFCGEMCKINIYRVSYLTDNGNGIKSNPIRRLLHTFHFLNNGNFDYKCDDIFEDRDIIVISAQSVVNQGAFSQGNIITCEVSGYQKTINFTSLS